MKTWISIAFVCAILACRISSASATPVYHAVPELPDAKQYILDALAQNKLVFIGENYSQVNEELFMAENMQAFYDAGLRYIFLEGIFTEYSPVSSQSPLPVSDNRIWLFPPWQINVGGRYEGAVFNQAILKINDAVPEAERIRLIPAEAGYNPTPEEGTDLNKRDQQAFKNISAFMEKLPPHKKAMIFYGGGHGQTTPTEWQADGETFLWMPMGVYLKEQYGDDFISIPVLSAKDERYNLYLDIPELRDSESKPKVVLSDSSDIANNSFIHTMLSYYDAIILDRELRFGIGNNYIPTYENLFAMYNNLLYLENDIDAWKNDVALFRIQNQGQYLQLIYYLKLWLGDSFDYRLWDTVKPAPVVIRLRDTKNSLREALNALNTSAIQEIALTLNAQDAQNMQRMRDYSTVMQLSALTDFLYDGFMYSFEETADDVYTWIADHMKEAIAIFPQDLWPYYWLAYTETELGDYDAAIAHWEYIIAQPLSYCLETLPRVYQKLSVCYAAIGDQATSDEYKQIGESLLNEHDLIVTDLSDVR